MRQLIKFCLVGASSTLIDFSVFWIVSKAFPSLPWWMVQPISFIFGVTNGFFWNRFWTFRAHTGGAAGQQYSKFVITNIIGLILTIVITKVFLVLITGQFSHLHNPPTNTLLLAKLCAIPIVVIWNFSAARFWTFKAPKAAAPSLGTPSSQ